MHSFNLTTEPWLPCLHDDGRLEELSTLDTLIRAHEFRAIAGVTPTQLPSLIRHLLAVLHQVYDGPKSNADWARIYEAGKFDEAAVRKYLLRVAPRMDLFDAEEPFAQTPGLVDKFNATPIAEMAFSSSNWGAAKELFCHRPADDAPVFSPAHAARALLAYHAFAPGGLVKKPDEPTSATGAPNNSMAVVVLLGKTLFETLCWNLLIRKGVHPVPSTAEDKPSWETPPPPRDLSEKKEPVVMPTGWLDMLTWNSRRVQLVTNEQGKVISFVRAVGKGMPPEWRDPMAAYSERKKRGLVAVPIRIDRMFWRDSHTLFAEVDAEKDQAPAAIVQLASLAYSSSGDDLDLPEHVGVGVFGMASFQARIDATRAEYLWVPPKLFEAGNGFAYGEIKLALGEANHAVFGLTIGLKEFARHCLSAGERNPDAGDVSNLAKSFCAEPTAWSEVGLLYQNFLADLASKTEAGDFSTGARDSFRERCLKLALAQFRTSTRSFDGTDALAAAALGQQAMMKYQSKLWKARKEAQEQKEKP